MGVSKSLTLVKFGGVPKLIEFGKFLRRRVDIGGNFKLVDFNRFFRF